MPLRDMVAQPRAALLLTRALERDRVSQAYLFAGPEGAGKEACARAFVQALVCEGHGDDACGACDGCRRACSGSHPDVLWVFTENALVGRKLAGRADFDATPSREIRIEQVRQLQARIALTPLVARRKAAVVVEAERMTLPAQNALLKALEEPPPGSTLILVSSASDGLLPTVRSRCTRVPFAPLPLAAVAEVLGRERALRPEQALLRARLAGGDLSRARAMSDADLAERREIALAFDELGPSARQALTAAERFAPGGTQADRDRALVALDVGASWWHDVAVAAACSDAVAPNLLLHGDLVDRVRASARRLGLGEALRRYELFAAARRLVDAPRNAHPRIQMEHSLLSMVCP